MLEASFLMLQHRLNQKGFLLNDIEASLVSFPKERQAGHVPLPRTAPLLVMLPARPQVGKHLCCITTEVVLKKIPPKRQWNDCVVLPERIAQRLCTTRNDSEGSHFRAGTNYHLVNQT